MDHYERQAMIDELQDANAETLRDIAERRARALIDPPREWRVPEREPREEGPGAVELRSMAAAYETQKLSRAMEGWHAHIEARLISFADMLGEETGKSEKRLREEFKKQTDDLREQLGALRDQNVALRDRLDASRDDIDMPVPLKLVGGRRA